MTIFKKNSTVKIINFWLFFAARLKMHFMCKKLVEKRSRKKGGYFWTTADATLVHMYVEPSHECEVRGFPG